MSDFHRTPLPRAHQRDARRRAGPRGLGTWAQGAFTLRSGRHQVIEGVIRVVVLGLITGALLWLGFQITAVSARPAYCLGVGIAAIALWSLVKVAQDPTDPYGQPNPAPTLEEPRVLAELATLEQQLVWASLDADRAEARVRPRLVELVTERLRQRHGIDPVREPDHARSLVGEEMWHLMTSPHPLEHTIGRREMARLVDRIEAL